MDLIILNLQLTLSFEGIYLASIHLIEVEPLHFPTGIKAAPIT